MAGSPIPNNSDAKTRINGKTILTVGGSGSILAGINYDSFLGEETSATVETYRYYLGGTSGTLQTTVVVTYSDATKCFVTEVERTDAL